MTPSVQKDQSGSIKHGELASLTEVEKQHIALPYKYIYIYVLCVVCQEGGKKFVMT